jgi:carboxymethylenebutenolidase
MSAFHIIEDELEFQTSDGTVDCVYFHVEGARRPAIINLPDGIGLRESQRDMARRLAREGYNVLLPNIYYRTSRYPFFATKPDFSDEATVVRFGELTRPLTPDAVVRDGSAYIDFLATRPEVDGGGMGIVGYCLTGAFALRIAASQPARIVAAAAFHGGRLFLDDASSPHLVLADVKARLYFGHARDDRGMPAEAIAKFEEALRAWGGTFESETYDARHGWTVPDSAAYDEPEAERAFAKLREYLNGARQLDAPLFDCSHHNRERRHLARAFTIFGFPLTSSRILSLKRAGTFMRAAFGGFISDPCSTSSPATLSRAISAPLAS